MSEESVNLPIPAPVPVIGALDTFHAKPMIITNLPQQDEKAVETLTRVRTITGKRLDELVNTPIEVVAVAAYDYEFADEKTGEIRTARNYALILPDGSHVTFTSGQAWDNLIMIAGMLKDWGPWNPPIIVKPVIRPLGENKRQHGFQYGGRGKKEGQ